MSFTIECRVNINVAAPYSLGSKTSDTGNWSALNGFISFKYIMSIHDVRCCCTVSQPDIIQNPFIYSVKVGSIMAIEIKVLPMLQGIKYYPARCNNARLLNYYC